MMTIIPEYCVNLTIPITTVILCITSLTAWYFYINNKIRMQSNKPPTNKITIRILATGFAVVYGIMLFPTSKETLDFTIYGWKIELYNLIKAIVFLGAIGMGSITGGTALSTFIKGKTDERD